MTAANDTINSVSLLDLWNILNRRKLLIAAIVLTLFAITGFYTKTATPEYQAEATILLVNQQPNLKIQSVMTDDANDPTQILSEMQVLTSRTLMAAVLEKLGLFKDPSLLYTPPSVFSKLSPSRLLVGTLSPSAAPSSPVNGGADASAAALRRQNGIIDAALGSLTVKQVDKSRAIAIDFHGRDPQLAANIVNTLSQLYLKQDIEHRYDAVRATSDYLSAQVKDLAAKAQTAESAAVAYRQEAGLVDNHGIDQIQQNIADLSQKLTAARADQAAARSQLGQLGGKKSLETAPAVLDSPLIQRLRDREAEARDQLASLAKEMGRENPKYIAARNQVAEIQSKIRQESSKIAEGLHQNENLADLNVGQMESQLATLKKQYDQYMVSNVKAQALEGEATATRALLETLNSRWKETQSQEDLQMQPAGARILSLAPVPTSPVSPKTKLLLLASLIAGLALGCGTAIAMDQFQTGIYNGKQLQSMTHVTNIAMVPKAAVDKSGVGPSRLLPVGGQSQKYMEKIRSIATYLRLKANRDPALRLINFTSASGAEGQSAMVASLAVQMATDGLRVLVVDCDMRHPTLTASFDLDGKPGISELLAGKATVADVVRRDQATGLSLIGAGNLNEPTIISRHVETWDKVMQDLMTRFDIILLDSPPMLLVSDSQVLAQASHSVLCVRWQKTPHRQVAFALDLLHRLECPLLGTVITMADGKSKNLHGAESYQT